MPYALCARCIATLHDLRVRLQRFLPLQWHLQLLRLLTWVLSRQRRQYSLRPWHQSSIAVLTLLVLARRKSILMAKIPSSLPIDYVLAVRVAHTALEPSSPISKFTTFQESWRCSITSGTTLTFYEFQEQVKVEGIALATHGAPNLHRILFPHGHGSFHLAANHLALKNPSPQLLTSLGLDYKPPHPGDY